MAKEKKDAAAFDRRLRPCPAKPHLMMRDFEFPERCNARTITVRELDGDDELEAAVFAERKVTKSMRDNPIYMMGIERKEAIRASIYAVDGEVVETPFAAIDRWSKRTERFVQSAFNEMNGVESEELKKFLGTEEPEPSQKAAVSLSTAASNAA
jgi:hypothetical protein